MYHTFYRLVPRYSRSRNGTLILYGAKHPAALYCNDFEALEKQLAETIESSHLARAGIQCSKDQMLVVILRAQLQHINVLWRTILTQPGGAEVGYCTNALDVQLCDALDTFSALEEATGQFEEFFYIRRTGYQDGGCTCEMCTPDMEDLLWMWQCAHIAHSDLPRPLIDRIFGELREAIAREKA